MRRINPRHPQRTRSQARDDEDRRSIISPHEDIDSSCRLLADSIRFGGYYIFLIISYFMAPLLILSDKNQ